MNIFEANMLDFYYRTEAYPGGSGPHPEKIEPQREHGLKFFGWSPDPPGYAHVTEWNAIIINKMLWIWFNEGIIAILILRFKFKLLTEFDYDNGLTTTKNLHLGFLIEWNVNKCGNIDNLENYYKSCSGIFTFEFQVQIPLH